MHPRDFNFSLKTGSDLANEDRVRRLEDLDSDSFNMLGMSMVFFEEAVKDAASYCAIKNIEEITEKEIIMGLQCQLLRNDGKSFLETSDLIKRSLEYCNILSTEEDEIDEEDEDAPANGGGRSAQLMTEEEKMELLGRFEYARAHWYSWHPDPEINQLGYLMKMCIQTTIDKLANAQDDD